MFEKDYRREMDNIETSETVIIETVKKVHDEETRLREQPNRETSINLLKTDDWETPVYTSDYNRHRMPQFFRIILTTAACLIVLLLGVILIPQIINFTNPPAGHEYVFGPVNGNTFISGGLNFGSQDNQPDETNNTLLLARCYETFLPNGLLDQPPIEMSGYEVYLGYDEQQNTCYAAYREDGSNQTWTLLHSNRLDRHAFTDVLENYFEQKN